MDDFYRAPDRLVFHPHWFAFWKPLTASCLLVLAGAVATVAGAPHGLILVLMGGLGLLAVYLFWSWHTLTFTEDNRLVRRRGILGCSEDVITLFGVLTHHQIPILGKALDVGSVHLGIPGPDIHIRHIGNFAAFYRRMLASNQPQARAEPPVIQLFFQVPAMPTQGGREIDRPAAR